MTLKIMLNDEPDSEPYALAHYAVPGAAPSASTAHYPQSPDELRQLRREIDAALAHAAREQARYAAAVVERVAGAHAVGSGN